MSPSSANLRGSLTCFSHDSNCGNYPRMASESVTTVSPKTVKFISDR